MRVLNRMGISATAMTLLTAAAAVAGTGSAAASGPIPIAHGFRNCDFSKVGTAVQTLRSFTGTGTAIFRTSGSTVSAEVHMVIPDRAGEHYEVGLIQGPRPSSATCGPGDPGTAFAGMDLDGLGQATVTITAPIQQGATGAWVKVTYPAEHNWYPAEFYSSEYLASI